MLPPSALEALCFLLKIIPTLGMLLGKVLDPHFAQLWMCNCGFVATSNCLHPDANFMPNCKQSHCDGVPHCDVCHVWPVVGSCLMSKEVLVCAGPVNCPSYVAAHLLTTGALNRIVSQSVGT